MRETRTAVDAVLHRAPNGERDGLRGRHASEGREQVIGDWLSGQLSSALKGPDDNDNGSDASTATQSGKRKASDQDTNPRPTKKSLATTTTVVHVWTHIAKIVLLTEDPKDFAHDGAFLRDRGALQELSKHKDTGLLLEDVYLTLGKFGATLSQSPPDARGSPKAKQPGRSKNHIMTVSYGGSVDPSDPLQAATLLIQAGRLTVDPVQIKVCITNARDPAKYSVYLLVQFRFFLNLDEIQNTTSFHELSDQTAAAQRNLISFLSDWPSSRAEEHDVDGVKYFLSCLAPAPALPSQISEQHLQPPNLQVQLYPFQQRSVYFMLNAEGYGISASGAVTKAQDHAKSSPFWKQVDIPTVDGPVSFWFNALTGGVQANAQPWASGVLLAETMGLGKTIEIISLIQLNTPVERNALGPYWDEELKVEVKPVKATLIVTPLSLLPQWADELRNRAPDLKVLEYTGKSKLMLLSSGKVAPPVLGKKGTGKAFDAIEEHATTLWHLAAQDYDVILTTFQELQSDLNVARPPVQRSRRMTAEYSEFVRARSPLILLDFARVVMDEVQQVGGGKAAEMVSLINRDSSIAVSGTPAKTGLKDLLHVLRFLRVPNITSSNWDLMITNPHYTELFKDLFRKIAVRTSKQVAGKEMKLAVQTRCVVPILLGPVEKHNYDERLADSLTALGMDPRGYPLVEDWSLDSVLLRQCIRKLRQACTHPQIGEADGRQGVAKGVRSIEQVLATMMENNMKLLFESRRSLIAERFLSILLTKQIHNNPTTMKDHIISLQEALRNIHSLMADIRKTKLEYRAREKHLNGPSTSAISLNGKAKGVAGATAKSGSGTRDADDESDGDTDSDDDEEDMGDHLGGRTKAKKKADGLNFNARLRQARILLHKAHFLLGNAYFQCGKSTEEAEAYALADDVRKRLLRSSQRIASRAMELLREREKGSEAAKFPIPTAQYPGEEPPPDDEASEGLTDPDDEPHGDPSDHSDSEWGSQNGQRKGKGKGSEKPRMEEKGTKGKGKESAETHGRKMKKPKENATVALYKASADVITLMNEQAELLLKWKDIVVGFLSEEWNAQEDGTAPEGDEYTRSLEVQANAEGYLNGMAALIADRRETMNAQRTLLAEIEHRDPNAKKRKTKTAAQADFIDETMEAVFAVQNPDQAVLQTQLNLARKGLRDAHTSKPLRGIMFDLRTRAKMARTKAERDAAADESKRIGAILNSQGELLEEFENDMAALRKAFNGRVNYFRNLQELSDTVGDIVLEPGMTQDQALDVSNAKANQLQATVKKSMSKQRYLKYLGDQYNKEGEETIDDDDKCCILCKCEFEKGYVTECAHVFCQSCLSAWMKKKPEGKACPVCREELNPKSMHRISFKGAPTADPITVDDLLPAQRTQLHYNSIDDDILQSIKLRDSLGRFGSKIQTLIQHLLYIQDHSPGTKSIVFSAWSDSLTIVGHALDINGLKYLRNDGPKARGKVNPVQQFQTDPQYQILLLHGERDNAGLNVTAARNVFLLEPVVNHSFEVQALARVDRLGSQDSNVYCYYAEETVEKNILDLAHRRGNSLYASHPVELDTDVAGARMESTAGVKGKAAKGDFVASTEDMLEIMFPEADNPATASTSDEIGGIQDVEMEDGDSQPRAGPSRLGG